MQKTEFRKNAVVFLFFAAVELFTIYHYFYIGMVLFILFYYFIYIYFYKNGLVNKFI